MKNLLDYAKEESSKGFALLFLFTLVLGCAYGRITPSPVTTGNLQEFLDQHEGVLDAAYSGDKDRPGAILFDIKNDGVQLKGDGWHPIKDKEGLHQMVAYVSRAYRYWGGDWTESARLYSVLNNSGKTIGYLLSPLDTAVVRSANGTYSVDPVTEPEIREKLRYPSIRGAGG
jgi:hypothetical protein